MNERIERRCGPLLVVLMTLVFCVSSSGANATDELPIKKITRENVDDLRMSDKQEKDVARFAWNRAGDRIGMLDFNKQIEIFIPPAKVPHQAFGQSIKPVSFDFGPDDDLFAYGENSTNATILNFKEGVEIEINTVQSQPSVKFSPDGKMLATGGYGTQAQLWSTKTGDLVKEFDVGPVLGGLTPVFSPDGKILAVGHRNASTRLFDVAAGTEVHVLNEAMSQGLSFDPTGKTLAVTYVDGHISLWDVATGERTLSAKPKAEELYSVDWSPDGQLLVTSGLHSKVIIWDAKDLSVLSEIDCPEWVICVKFNPDGTKLMFSGGGRLPNDGRWIETWSLP